MYIDVTLEFQSDLNPVYVSTGASSIKFLLHVARLSRGSYDKWQFLCRTSNTLHSKAIILLDLGFLYYG
jgi:3-deoxy-D-manno-octulosonic-acid transferase